MIYICIPTTPERRNRLKELLHSIDQHTENVEHSVVVYENNDGGWVKAVHKMLEGINGYVVLLGSDVVVEKDWLKNLWDAFISAFPNGDGAAQPYDEINQGRLCQHPLAHSDTIKKYLFKGYIHNFSDDDLTAQLKLENKYIYVPESKIDHRHMVIGKAPEDETYRIVFNKENWEKDRELFLSRTHYGFTTN